MTLSEGCEIHTCVCNKYNQRLNLNLFPNSLGEAKITSTGKCMRCTPGRVWLYTPHDGCEGKVAAHLRRIYRT